MAGMGGWFRWPLKSGGKPEPVASPPHKHWDVVEIGAMCLDTTHPVTFGICEGVVRSIHTPCGYAASRAMDALADRRSCWAMIEPMVLVLTDDEEWRKYIAPIAAPDTNQSVQALGGTEGARKRSALRHQRRDRAAIPSWNRQELTTAALLRLVQRKAGEGTTVTLETRNGTRVITIKYAEDDHESSTYHFIAGSWGAGSGPQGSDEVYRALQQWGRILANAAELPGRRRRR